MLRDVLIKRRDLHAGLTSLDTRAGDEAGDDDRGARGRLRAGPGPPPVRGTYNTPCNTPF